MLKDLIRAARAPKNGVDVVRAIDSFLVRRASRPRHRERDVWHPSDIVSDDFCARYEILRRRYAKVHDKPPEEVNVERERIFDVGHALHRWYQEEYLGPSGILWGKWRCSRCHAVVHGLMPRDSCELCQFGRSEDKEGPDLTSIGCSDACGPRQEDDPEADGRDRLMQEVGRRGGCVHCGRWGRWEFVETTISIPDLCIFGRIDGLLVDETGEPSVVCDIKTTNERRFAMVLKEGPPGVNNRQLHLYMHGLKKSKGCFLYVCKNDGRIHQHHVDYDRAVIQADLDRVRAIERYDLDPKATLPDRHPSCRGVASPMAISCPARKWCFPEVYEDG